MAEKDKDIEHLIPTILGTLRISQSDLMAMIDPDDSPITFLPKRSDPLTLANLSALFRFCNLARALHVSIPTLITSVRMISVEKKGAIISLQEST